MMTPDTRPIGVLTPEILATASHWCIRWGDNALTVPAREVTIFSTVIDAYGLTFGSGSDSKTTCYPCTLQPNGLVVPEPWPVLDGEEEIEEWRGYNDNAQRFFDMAWGWCLVTDVHAPNPFLSALRAGQCPGMIPGLRRGNRWVWEKDRC